MAKSHTCRCTWSFNVRLLAFSSSRFGSGYLGRVESFASMSLQQTVGENFEFIYFTYFHYRTLDRLDYTRINRMWSLREVFFDVLWIYVYRNPIDRMHTAELNECVMSAQQPSTTMIPPRAATSAPSALTVELYQQYYRAHVSSSLSLFNVHLRTSLRMPQIGRDDLRSAPPRASTTVAARQSAVGPSAV